MSFNELMEEYRRRVRRFLGPASDPFQKYVNQGLREIEQFLAEAAK